MRRVLCVLLCLMPAANAVAQTATIRASAQIVVVDVTVTDSRGIAIHGLKQTDFTVMEDNAPQTVAHFDEHTAATAVVLPQMPALAPNTYTNYTPAPADAAVNILLIDTLNTPLNDQANARQKLITFAKSMKPGTNLAVFSLGAQLVMLQGFGADSKLVLAAVTNGLNVQQSPTLPDSFSAEALSDTVRIPSPTIKETMRQGEVQHTSDQNRLRIVTTLNAMNQLARYLAGVPGRKNLIWVSGSFPLTFLPNMNVKNSFITTDSFQSEVRETTNLLARSQVAIYPVDARGAQTTPLSDVSSSRYAYGSGKVLGDVDTFSTQNVDEQGTMRHLAEATGGNATLNNNDLGGAVERAIDDGSSYYTLTYSPSDKAKSGYHKITVKLAEEKYRLAYRDGYYADDSAKPAAVTGSGAALPDFMQVAMQRGAPPPTQILFKALFAADSKTSEKPAEGNVAAQSKPPYRIITIAYAANPGDITMPAGANGLRHVDLDFVALVYDRDGRLFTQQVNRVDVFAKPEAVQDFAREGVRFQQQIAVPAKGEYYVRSGIHDLLGDRIGAIEVPASSITAGH
ncbi:MAG TPA: VWA domain-containing protein [Edaphobacter sp.]